MVVSVPQEMLLVVVVEVSLVYFLVTSLQEHLWLLLDLAVVLDTEEEEPVVVKSVAKVKVVATADLNKLVEQEEKDAMVLILPVVTETVEVNKLKADGLMVPVEELVTSVVKEDNPMLLLVVVVLVTVIHQELLNANS